MVKRFPEYSIHVKKIFAAGDFLILHGHIAMKANHWGNEKKGFIITDIFKLKDGMLAEHWNAIRPLISFQGF